MQNYIFCAKVFPTYIHLSEGNLGSVFLVFVRLYVCWASSSSSSTHNAEHLFPGDCLIYIIWVDGGTLVQVLVYVGHPAGTRVSVSVSGVWLPHTGTACHSAWRLCRMGAGGWRTEY